MAGTPIKFTGTFSLTIDAKNRVNMPATFRDSLKKRYPWEDAESVYLAKAQWGEGIAVYPVQIFEGRAVGKTPLRTVTDEEEYKMHAQAEACPIDNAGRIRIPDHMLKKSAFIKGTEIAFCGHGDFMQIWDPQKADNFMSAPPAAQAKNPGGENPSGGEAPVAILP